MDKHNYKYELGLFALYGHITIIFPLNIEKDIDYYKPKHQGNG
jgi:hypothetical protein